MNRKATPIERVFLLATVLLAAYQVAVGIEGLGELETFFYTIGFGVLLVSCLLLIILGYDILGTPSVVLLATVIPLSISTGLVHQFAPVFFTVYLVFDLVGLTLIFLTRYWLSSRIGASNKPGKGATAVIAVVHGISGFVIFCMPFILAWRNVVPPGFVLVGLGGALFGLTGILLFFLRAGISFLSADNILRIFLLVLGLTSISFTVGFSFL